MGINHSDLLARVNLIDFDPRAMERLAADVMAEIKIDPLRYGEGIMSYITTMPDEVNKKQALLVWQYLADGDLRLWDRACEIQNNRDSGTWVHALITGYCRVHIPHFADVIKIYSRFSWLICSN